MNKFIIRGGRPLQGRVRISGAKNAALALIAASILARGETILENIPRIDDVETMLNMITTMGGRAEWMEENGIKIQIPEGLEPWAPYRLARKLRASSLLLGALIGRLGQARVALPGGDDIGSRPLDLHIKGLEALGVEITVDRGFIRGQAPQLLGNRIYLDFPSVGATENIMMAAAVAKGQTIIENCAKEPEVVDLANFLNAMGAKVRGAGTDIIRIEGVLELVGTRYAAIPDRIEAGTFMVAAAVTGGELIIENVIPTHLQAVIAKMQEMGVHIEEEDDILRVDGRGLFRSVDVKTLPYPGFATDMQSQIMVLLSLVPGTSLVVENVYENRMRLVDELKRMGAKIKVEGRTAIIEGVEYLTGAQVRATDLRAGAALVLAGLAAQGETEVSCIGHVDRGYENLEGKLVALGADITRVD